MSRLTTMIKLLRAIGRSKSKLKHSPKTAAKARKKKSTYHLHTHGGSRRAKTEGRQGKARKRWELPNITVDAAAKRMRQRGDNPMDLYTSSSGGAMDSMAASARFIGRRKLGRTSNPFTGPAGRRKSNIYLDNWGR